MLLIGAGLLMRSFVKLQHVDIGFDPRGLYLAPVSLPQTSYPEPERVAQFSETILERARSLPGVISAAAVNSAPFAGPNPGLAFVPVDHPVAAREQAPDADYRVITPGYLQTMAIPLLHGRDFTAMDRADAPSVALVSQTLARRNWPNEDPIGRRVRIGDVIRGPEYTVVGIVGDARYQSLETPETRPMLYFSALARPPQSMTLVMRGSHPDALSRSVRALVTAIDPALPPPSVSDMQELIGFATATRRFALVLFTVFAGSALLLAVVGIYGVMSYLVRQRTHEMGIRIALGAPLDSVVSLVVGKALRLTVAGVIVGLFGAWALTRSLSSLLFGIEARDPLTFAGVAALLTAAAVLASLVPARRATRADPMLALRGP
jgi:predicted permease